MTHLLLIVCVVVFLVIFPLWDILELRQLKSLPNRKLGYYWRAIIVLWTTTIVAAWYFGATTFWQAPSYAAQWSRGFASPLVVGFAALLLALLLLPLGLAFRRERLRLAVAKAAERFAYLLPETDTELLTFIVVSVTAGVCEEWLFRGMLMHVLPQLVPFLPVAMVLIVTSAMFGLGHAGQGWTGMATTALFGAVLAVMYLASGNLLLPIIVHGVIDLRAILITKLRATQTNRALVPGG